MVASDTIFALSSGGVRSGVAVIRVSGPAAHNTISELTQKATLPPSRLASVRKLFNPTTGELLDQGLVLRFDQGHSFTGEVRNQRSSHALRHRGRELSR